MSDTPTAAARASAGPTDWVSGERVFAPPAGTLDPDWLVPAVLEAVPGATPGQAQTAVVAAWQATRAAEPVPGGTPLERAAAGAVAEAVRAFGA
ncbi:hypothetical protein J4G33_01880 [Actinotalea sp. BY-33]|uniref:Uncharacterized protein n=1 Tax=Actinotalea soli TaxID=2819234 RepID=A0A939LMR1_9CELL|nr:hypothetical protein [Actinotalea soli]MBO1750546.1 hypothetical protein [Actinotalea soli]